MNIIKNFIGFPLFTLLLAQFNKKMNIIYYLLMFYSLYEILKTNFKST